MAGNEKSDKMSGLNEVCSVLCKIDDPEQMRAFLKEILTPAECRDLSLRWELMKMLEAGVPQRQIAHELGVSLCKITRGAKILKQDHSISKDNLIAGEHNESKNSTG
jgi:TrpR family trp operon transcriptional repressor